ncbi:MAG: His-Xaa-Ser system radical SAM maturase HxsB [Methylophilaceae bacterium]|nr:His-Xaa-Ser system radical SAM maturase HxsB [Methylophilaceae bacterium]
MSSTHKLYPFKFHRFSLNELLVVSTSGDFSFLEQSQLEQLIEDPKLLPLPLQAELKSKFFWGGSESKGTLRLLTSRIATKKELVTSGPSLHIFVPTLQCEHTCKYCQVSRSLESSGFSMSEAQIDLACDTVFQSPSQSLTIEFQGGDPLLRFDLICRAIDRISLLNISEKRDVRFIVTSTLHQLTESMCSYFKENNVYFSTSIDGPISLHNANRPLPNKDSYQRTLHGISMVRELVGCDSVSALMTTTKSSLLHPEEIVDEYVRLGFKEIFLRPLSMYGFAHRNRKSLSYSLDEYKDFYEKAFDRIIFWNKNGYCLQEAATSILLNKMLSPFDNGYVDLQSPTGSGLATLVYNYDGYVYPSDESRMIVESGDTSLRLGKIGDKLEVMLRSPVMQNLVRFSLVNYVPSCSDCAFNNYCGPDLVEAKGKFGSMSVPVMWTDHCKRHKWLFDLLFRKLKSADEDFLNLAYNWAKPKNLN